MIKCHDRQYDLSKCKITHCERDAASQMSKQESEKSLISLLSCLFTEEQGWGRTPTMVGLSRNADPADSVKSINIETDVKEYNSNKT